MDTNVIFRKTQKGLEEIERRTYRLPPRERLLLIQIDGRRNLATLSGKAGGEREGLDTAGRLLTGGFIEVVPAPLATTTGLRPSAPPPTTRPITPGAGTGTLIRNDGRTGAGAAPVNSSQPAPGAQRPGLSRPSATQNGNTRPGSWLTSTVAHLTNMFNQTGEDDIAAPRGQQSRPRPVAADPRNGGHHPGATDPMAATVIHTPLFDPAEGERGISPRLNGRDAARPQPIAQPIQRPVSTMVAQKAPTQPAPIPSPVQASPTASNAWTNLADAADDIPMLDVTASLEGGHPSVRNSSLSGNASTDPFLAAFSEPTPPSPGLAGSVPRSPQTIASTPSQPGHLDGRLSALSIGRAPTESAAQATVSDCVNMSACVGCPHCPTNTVSRTRRFMKDHLLRLSGSADSPVIAALDHARTLVDLQRQFEGWLRELLRTSAGCEEAPALAAEMQRMINR